MESIAAAGVDIRQQDERTGKPVLLLRVHLRERHDFLLRLIQLILREIALCKQVLRLCAVGGAHFLCHHLQVSLSVLPLLQCYVGFRAVVARLCHHGGFVAVGMIVGEYLPRNVYRRTVLPEVIGATQDAQPCDVGILRGGRLREQAVEIVERGSVVCRVVTQFRHAHARLFHVRVACYLRQRFVLAQGVRGLHEAVVCVRQLLLRSGAVATPRAVLA